MLNKIKTFLATESGAVTVDWVVLTAAVVALAGTVIFSIQDGSEDVGDGVGNYLSDSTAGDF